MRTLFMRTVLLTALAASLGAGNAFAQTRSFEGVTLSLSLSAHHSETDVGVNNANAQSVTSSSANGAAQVQYNLALQENFVLGFGASLALGDVTLADISSGGQLRVSNMNTYYIAPGYTLNDSTLLYAKLGHVSGSVNDTDGNLGLHGLATGLGVQFAGSKNLMYSLEVVRNKFSTSSTALGTTIDLRDTALNAGLGYRFQ